MLDDYDVSTEVKEVTYEGKKEHTKKRNQSTLI